MLCVKSVLIRASYARLESAVTGPCALHGCPNDGTDVAFAQFNHWLTGVSLMGRHCLRFWVYVVEHHRAVSCCCVPSVKERIDKIIAMVS